MKKATGAFERIFCLTVGGGCLCLGPWLWFLAWPFQWWSIPTWIVGALILVIGLGGIMSALDLDD